jgi:hypothetical protein
MFFFNPVVAPSSLHMAAMTFALKVNIFYSNFEISRKVINTKQISKLIVGKLHHKFFVVTVEK